MAQAQRGAIGAVASQFRNSGEKGSVMQLKIFAHHIHQCSDPWDGATPRDLELREMLLLLLSQLEAIMALNAQVQALVDAVAANKNGVKAALDGLAAEATQISALQAQIAALTPGQPIDADDLAAITQAVTDLGDTNSQLQTAVPANVQPAAPSAV